MSDTKYIRNAYAQWYKVIYAQADQTDKSVTMPLTALNLHLESDWERLKELRICKSSLRLEGLYPTQTLARTVVQDLTTKLGAEWYSLMDRDDLYELVDWERYDSIDKGYYNGGGIPLALVLKRPEDFPLVTEYWTTLITKDTEQGNFAKLVQEVADNL